MPPPRMLTRAALPTVCLLGWAAVTNYTNHAALLPLLMRDLQFGPAQAGLLSSAFFITLSVVFVPAGILSDRVGAKTVGTVGLAITFVSTVALGGARGFGDLVLLKIASGIGCGAAFIAGVRYVTAAFPAARRHAAQGLYGGFVQLGGGTSVYLLPWLAHAAGWRAAFALSSTLVAATLVVWVVAAPDVRTTSPATVGFAGAVRSGKAWRLGIAHAGTFGLAVLVGTWVTTFLVHDVNTTLVTAGAAGSVVLLLGLLARPLGGLVLDRRRLSTRAMVMLSFGVGALGLGILSLPHPSLAAATVALAAIGVAANMPYAAVMNAAAHAAPGSPGASVGLTSAVAILFLALAVPLVGAVYQATGGFATAFGALAVLSAVAGWSMRAIDDEPAT